MITHRHLLKTLLLTGFMMSFTPIINGCATTDTTRNDIQWKVITIEQGKTDQNHIISILGPTLSYSDYGMSYDTEDYKNLYINLDYIDNDGDEFNYIIRPNSNNENLTINLDDNDIVSSISVY